MTSRSVALLIPTLGRPGQLADLLANVHDAAGEIATPYLLVEPHDQATREAAEGLGAQVVLNEGPSSYPSCINTGYRRTTEPFLFTGADDICVRPGALEAAVACMEDPAIGVVGTHDPIHPFPDHSTHSLVRRSYVEEQGGSPDLEETVLYPYGHAYTDLEIVLVAKMRKAYRYCEDALVEHHHPGWTSLGLVAGEALDATYLKGNRAHRRDFAIFVRRARTWLPHLEGDSPADGVVRELVRKYSGPFGAARYQVRRWKQERRARSRARRRARNEAATGAR